MTPDDPRHGTNAGYVQHAFTDRDYCQPCREAHAEYRRNLWRRRYARRLDALHVPSIGSQRRARALLALGHTHAQIAAAGGGTPNMSKNIVAQKHATVHVDTAAAISRAYDKLSMVVPTGWRAEESRRRARELGYLPPLAWDDETIDDAAARPRTGTSRFRKRTSVDEVAVERAVSGDRVHLSHAERFLVVGRLRAEGMSIKRIGEHTGITKPERYIEREAS